MNFSEIEYLCCGQCSAIVSVSEKECEYCGASIYKDDGNAEILALAAEIDHFIGSGQLDLALDRINSSNHTNQPVLIFRKAKILLLKYISNDGILDSYEFCQVLKSVNDASLINSIYEQRFLDYLDVILPSENIIVSELDFRSIIEYAKEIDFLLIKQLIHNLAQQVLVGNLGFRFILDYIFYSDSKNHLDNDDFKKKKEYVTNKYKTELDKLESII